MEKITTDLHLWSRESAEESKNNGSFPEVSLTTRWPWVFLDLQISVWAIWKLQPRQAGEFGGGYQTPDKLPASSTSLYLGRRSRVFVPELLGRSSIFRFSKSVFPSTSHFSLEPAFVRESPPTLVQLSFNFLFTTQAAPLPTDVLLGNYPQHQPI